VVSEVSKSAELLRVAVAGKPHVWCAEHGWHDAATHGDEEVKYTRVRVDSLPPIKGMYDKL
jgi:hypothetical protein